MKLSYTSLVLISTVLCGCQSGLYKVSTSEDDKKTDKSVRYYTLPPYIYSFIKDDGASPDGILYDEDWMPVLITEVDNFIGSGKSGWSDYLWMFSIGLFPKCQSEYMTRYITVKTPIGEKSGSYRIDAKLWHGWIPILVGFPGSADERDANPKLPNRRIENIARERLVKNLVGQFSFKEYVAFAKRKNGERKAEIARIKAVSEKVDNFLAKNRFSEAETLITDESKSCSATQECDAKSWADMRERVIIARQAYDKKHIQGLVANGKYEDAILYCNSKSSLPPEVNEESKNKVVKAAVNELNDATRLIALLKLIKRGSMQDDIIMKLKALNSLSKLTTKQLVEIVNNSKSDDVILSIIREIKDKHILTSLLDKKRSANVLKALLEKIADADAVRTKIWAGNNGNEEEKCIYVSVYASEDEYQKLIQAYPDSLTDNVLEELKKKASKEQTRMTILSLQAKRLAMEIFREKEKKGLPYVVEKVGSIGDKSMRSKVALQILWKLPKHLEVIYLGAWRNWGREKELNDIQHQYSPLINHMTDEDVDCEIRKIMKACESRIHFEGLYVRMPLQEYFLLKHRNPAIPPIDTVRWKTRNSTTWWIAADMHRIYIDRTARYKLFEKEDGEFWSAFMRKYIPAGTENNWQFEYDEELEELCDVYKSMKYGTKVIFGVKSGVLVLEELK